MSRSPSYPAVASAGAPRRAAAQHAFTLIEMLVVVAIISVLAALLMPALTKSRAKARQVVCGSQLKQLGTAFMMYVDDSDELIPLLCLTHASSTGCCNNSIGGYGVMMTRYVGNGSAFPYNTLLKCPSANTRPGNWWDRSSTYLWQANNFGRYDECNPSSVSFAARPFPNFKMNHLLSFAKWGQAPAVLLMDKAFMYSGVESDVNLRNNHREGGGASGSNAVVHDGSVSWIPYDPATWRINSWAMPPGLTGHTPGTSGGSRIHGANASIQRFQGGTTMATTFATAIGH